MKIPLAWLKEFVPVRLDAERLAERLTLAGFEVEGIVEEEGDKVLDLAVTPNRGDCLSLLGMAREVSALCSVPLRQPKRQQSGGAGKMRGLLAVDLQEPVGCPRYSVRLIRQVRVGPSPDWLVRRLRQCGVRSINNVVDVTNYILLERGQPLHSFDAGKIKSPVTIRKARSGETLVTLDGEVRRLAPEDLVIADSRKILALAGIMGGGDSEVDSETKEVALESAFFDPVWIRRTARRLGLATESSYRFARRVDPEAILEALQRASELVVQLAGGKPTEDWIDRYPRKITRRHILFDPASVERLLGGEWAYSEVERKLKKIGLCKERRLAWEIPSYRGDLQEGVDLVEEVARTSGLDRIPKTLPSLFPELSLPSRERAITGAGRQRMAHLGFFETIHLSFLSPKDLHPQWLEQAVPLSNPLGQEVSLLRPSLIPSLLKTASFQHQHRIFGVRLFELRKIFWRGEGRVREALSLAAVATGAPLLSHWSDPRKEVDFFDMKGVLEGFCLPFGVPLNFEKGESPVLLPGKAARILIRGEEFGWVGEVHPRIADHFELKRPAILFEFSWEKFLAALPAPARFQKYSRVPQVERDLALVVDEAVPSGKICQFLQDRELVRRVKIFDLYRGNQIPTGKKSIAFSLLLGREDRTMTEVEINEAWRRIQESVRREFYAEIR